jgi:hypothetical protein
MLQWETADEHADYSFERYRAVTGKHENRIFYGPEGGNPRATLDSGGPRDWGDGNCRSAYRTAHSKLSLK